MADTVETAIYKLGYGVDGQDKVDALRGSVDKLVESSEKQVAVDEKVTRATRTRADSADRLLAKLDEQTRNEQRLQAVKEQVARFADEGVGTEQKRAQILDAANKKYGEGEVAVSGFGRVLQWLGLQHKAAGAEVEEHGRRTNAIKDAMNLLRPAAEAAGTSIGNLGPFAAAARLGLTGLGIAITGSVILALIDAADKARVLRSALDALTGNKEGGAAAFGGLKQSAESAGVSVNTLKGAYQELLLAQDEQNRKRGVVFAPGAETATKQINALTEALALAGKAGLLTEQQISQGTNIVAQSLAQTGKLTGDAFMQLMRTVPQLGRAIMGAMGDGEGSVSRFRDRLNEGDVSLGKLSDGLDRLLPKLREVNKETPGTLAQGWDALKTQVEQTTEALSKGLGVDGLVNNFTRGLKLLTNDTGTFFSELVDMVGAGAQKVVQAEIDIFSKGPAVLAAQLATASAMIANWVAGSLAAFARVAAAALGAASTATSGAGPAGSAGGGGGGGYGGGVDYASDYGNFSNQLNSTLDSLPEFNASGLDRVIPPGYPNDSFPVRMNVESGERLIVVPRNQTLSDFIGGKNPINLGRLAGGINLDVGPGGSTSAGPNIDAAITQQGNRLLDLGASYQDLLGKLGVTFDDWRETISGAGNDDIPDVIRKTGIQIITSESMSCAKIVAAINNNSAQVSGAIGAMSSLVSSNAANSAAAASSANMGGGVSPYSSPIGYGGGNVAMGGGAVGGSKSTDGWAFSSRGDYGPTPAPVPRAPNYRPQTGFPVADPFAGGPSSGIVSAGALPPTQGYDESGFTGDTNYYDGYYASGVEFDVPPGFPNDSFRKRLNLTSGEHVSITPPGFSYQNERSAGALAPQINKSVTVQQTVIYQVDLKQVGLSPAQLADQGRKAFEYAARSA